MERIWKMSCGSKAVFAMLQGMGETGLMGGLILR